MSGTKTPSGMLSAREESAPARQTTVELVKGGEAHGRTLHGAGPDHDATEAYADAAFSRQPGTAAGPTTSPRRTAHGERKGGDHRSTLSHHDGGGMRSGRLLWQERQDPVQGLRSRPENRGRQAEVQADETSATAGDTGDDGVAFTGGAVAPSPSKVVREHGSVGKGVGHVLVFVAAVVLGCAVLLCCTALFGKHAGTHAGTHVGTVKECISMTVSSHAVRSLNRVKKCGKGTSGKSAPHMCSG